MAGRIAQAGDGRETDQALDFIEVRAEREGFPKLAPVRECFDYPLVVSW